MLTNYLIFLPTRHFLNTKIKFLQNFVYIILSEDEFKKVYLKYSYEFKQYFENLLKKISHRIMKKCLKKNSLSKPKLNNNRFEDKKTNFLLRMHSFKVVSKMLAEMKQNYEIRVVNNISLSN
jgi:hypothetical protein